MSSGVARSDVLQSVSPTIASAEAPRASKFAPRRAAPSSPAAPYIEAIYSVSQGELPRSERPGLRVTIPAPNRPAPVPSVLRPSVEEAFARSKSFPPSSAANLAALGAEGATLLTSPAAGALRDWPHVQPLQMVSAAHYWLAGYLLDAPAPYGSAQLLAEDMLGAGILGASATGCAPLVKEPSHGQHRPLMEFKAFVEGLGRWVAAAPLGTQASYRVAAMRIGRARMRREAILELQCLNLATLPDELGQLGLLRTLDVRRNRLTVLPANFRALRALEELYLEDNQFTKTPDAIAGMHIDNVHINLCAPQTPGAQHAFVDLQQQVAWL